jgi:hypothetical protein
VNATRRPATDPARTPTVHDPDDRELAISCGCALFNLRVASAAAGLQAQVEPWPDAAGTDLLARVRLAPGRADPADAALQAAMAERRTYRERFAATAVDPMALRSLVDAVHCEAASLAVLTTVGDSPRDWLAAGQALQRLLLLGVQLGLQASYLNQPVQVATLRSKLQQLTGCPGYAQLLLRIGTPTQVKPAAPRRPLADVLVTAS